MLVEITWIILVLKLNCWREEQRLRSLGKKHRAMHPNKLFDERAGYREDLAGVEKDSEHQVEGLKGDVKGFFEQVFGFTPYKYQLELADLFEKNQFTAVRWCRQSGQEFFGFSFASQVCVGASG